MPEGVASKSHVLTPRMRPTRPIPRFALIVLVASVLASVVGGALDLSVFDVLHALGIVGAIVAGIVLAMWLEERVFTALVGRHTALRVVVGISLPGTALVLGFLASLLAAWVGDLIGDDGALVSASLVAMMWIVSASLGSLSVVALDVIISALVPSFRSRVQLAVLGLLSVTSGIAVAIYAAGIYLARAAREVDPSSLPEGAELDLGAGVMGRIEIVEFMQREEIGDVITLIVICLAVVLSVPAVLSATGKIAEAVMERLHPLTLGFRSLSDGDLAVRVEEGGSRDFIQISQGFNRMTESLSRTLEDLDARNRDLFQTNQATSRFVPFQFLKLLGKESIREIELGQHRAIELSILFCDIRGFTTFAEKMGPEETFRFINRYLERMEPEIHRCGGFINDFFGDGVMALFPSAPDSAIWAALGMLEELEGLNRELESEGSERIGIGIGINTGPLMLGTIGGRDRLTCTVVGDPANLASRIEGMTRLYGSNLIISEGTHAALQSRTAFALREIDRVRAKGKRKPVTVYEVLDGEPAELRRQKEATLSSFGEALSNYRSGKLEWAKQLFTDCHRKAPNDVALQVYLQRCDTLLQQGVPNDWNGVTDLRFK